MSSAPMVKKIREIRDKFSQPNTSFPEPGLKNDKVTIRGPKSDVYARYKYLRRMNEETKLTNFSVEVPIYKQNPECLLGDQQNPGRTSYLVSDRRSGTTSASCRSPWKQSVARRWFVVLTTCGSLGAETEAFFKNMIQEVISKNFGVKSKGHKELMYMNLLNSYSGWELRFTGWGIFEIDKKLFLTVSGVLVTYGVLFASELRKAEI
ncbi:uncharacterized protein NPIL_395631 [Nephila pilipes]|uniref:Uncharacterized protein n=1 Tax=Nephila pilipes TaxID=299642 RepID=A0A8X6MIR2_NEPPI|nr:uncharacterized protein NPIL_395631 [Nephila pilipes]